VSSISPETAGYSAAKFGMRTRINAELHLGLVLFW